MLRVDNGPEFLSQILIDWAKEKGVLIQHIQPGKPNQNAFIERFNRTYRNKVLDLYLFRNLDEVREITSRWLVSYDEQRPHDALGGLPPVVYAKKLPGALLSNCLLDREACAVVRWIRSLFLFARLDANEISAKYDQFYLSLK